MKKIILIIALFLTALSYSQDNRPPQDMRRGITTPRVVLDTLTTTQKLALPQIKGTVVYDVTLNELQSYDGSNWVSGGGSDLSSYQLKPTEGPFVDGDKTKLDSAVQPEDLGEVATSNSYLDLDDKPAFKVVQNTYADMAVAFANQAQQTATFIQYVQDASDYVTSPEIVGGRYFEYLGTTTGTDADYRLLSEAESAPISAAVFNVIDEGNGFGYREKSINPVNVGNIGFKAFDFGNYNPTVLSSTLGATGFGSLVMGGENSGPGHYSFTNGYQNRNGAYSGFINGTYNIIGTNTLPFPFGGDVGYTTIGGIRNVNSKGFGNALFGAGHLMTESYSTTVVGTASLAINSGSTLGTKPEFVVGNGVFNWNAGVLDVISRSNAFVVYKSGRVSMPIYGDGTFTGTPTYAAAFDVNGNFIEVPLGTGSTDDQNAIEVPVADALGLTPQTNVEDYLAENRGLINENIADIETNSNDILDLDFRIDELEAAPDAATIDSGFRQLNSESGEFTEDFYTPKPNFQMNIYEDVVVDITNTVNGNNLIAAFNNPDATPRTVSLIGTSDTLVSTLVSEKAFFTMIRDSTSRNWFATKGTPSNKTITVTGDGNTNINWRKSPYYKFVVGMVNDTLDFTPPESSMPLQLIIKQHATTPRNIEFGGAMLVSGSLPTFTNTANAIDIVDLFYDKEDNVFIFKNSGLNYQVVDGAYDVTPPSAPTSLVASDETATTIDLAWSAASDNVAVTGYRAYNSGTLLQSFGNVTTGTLTSLTPLTEYNITLRAIDAAGNESVNSNLQTITTAEGTYTMVARVNIGGAGITATDGLMDWEAGNGSLPYTGTNYYMTGTSSNQNWFTVPWTTHTSVTLPSGNYDTLNNSGRYGTMVYSFPHGDGNYKVKFYTGEVGGSTAVGARVFDMVIEGIVVDDNVDLVDIYGGVQIGVMREYNVAVTDGVLTIAPTVVIGNIPVLGFEIYKAD